MAQFCAFLRSWSFNRFLPFFDYLKESVLGFQVPVSKSSFWESCFRNLWYNPSLGLPLLTSSPPLTCKMAILGLTPKIWLSLLYSYSYWAVLLICYDNCVCFQAPKVSKDFGNSWTIGGHFWFLKSQFWGLRVESAYFKKFLLRKLFWVPITLWYNPSPGPGMGFYPFY